MADYPAFTILASSRPEPRKGGRSWVMTEGGAARVFEMFAQDWEDFVLEHELTQADVETLETFWRANPPGVNITLDYLGASKTVQFIEYPDIRPLDGIYRKVRVRLREVAT